MSYLEAIADTMNILMSNMDTGCTSFDDHEKGVQTPSFAIPSASVPISMFSKSILDKVSTMDTFHRARQVFVEHEKKQPNPHVAMEIRKFTDQIKRMYKDVMGDIEKQLKEQLKKQQKQLSGMHKAMKRHLDEIAPDTEAMDLLERYALERSPKRSKRLSPEPVHDEEKDDDDESISFEFSSLSASFDEDDYEERLSTFAASPIPFASQEDASQEDQEEENQFMRKLITILNPEKTITAYINNNNNNNKVVETDVSIDNKNNDDEPKIHEMIENYVLEEDSDALSSYQAAFCDVSNDVSNDVSHNVSHDVSGEIPDEEDDSDYNKNKKSKKPRKKHDYSVNCHKCDFLMANKKKCVKMVNNAEPSGRCVWHREK